MRRARSPELLSPEQRLSALLLPALVCLAVLTGCTDADDEPRQGSGGSSPTVSASPADPARALTDELLADAERPAAVATATGVLTVGRTPVDVAVDVLELRATEATTLLRWRLRSPGEQRVSTFGSSMARPGLTDTRGIVVTDQTGGARLQPYTYESADTGTFPGDVFCACSSLPRSVGPDGVVLTAVLPPLDAVTTSVDVLLPGIAPMAGVPVVR